MADQKGFVVGAVAATKEKGEVGVALVADRVVGDAPLFAGLKSDVAGVGALAVLAGRAGVLRGVGAGVVAAAAVVGVGKEIGAGVLAVGKAGVAHIGAVAEGAKGVGVGGLGAGVIAFATVK